MVAWQEWSPRGGVGEVKMRIRCDSCEKNTASVMCCADEAALCTECDARIHAANKPANKHARVSLHTATDSAKCDICQEKRGFFFCLEDRALLCRNCDVSIHSANALLGNHKRFLVTGTRVALEELEDDQPAAEPPLASPANSTMSSQSSHCSRGPSLSSPISTLQGPCKASPASSGSVKAGASVYRTPSACTPCCSPGAPFSGSGQVVTPSHVTPSHQEMGTPVAPEMISLPSSMGTGGVANASGMRRSSFSEFLTDAVPGWRVDELLNFVDCNESLDFAPAKNDGNLTALGGDFDWTADLSLFEEQMFAMHEVPQFPAPAAPQLAAPPRSRHHHHPHIRNRSKQDLYVPNGYGDASIVPEMRMQSGPAPSSLPKRFKRDLHY